VIPDVERITFERHYKLLGMIDGENMSELQLIRRIRAGAASRNGAVRVGIGDDCAVLRVPAGHEMVVTTDFSLEGRHFRRDWHSAQSAGHRGLARGLSDVAAMGGKPLAAFLSLALPKGFEVTWFDGFMVGFNALAGRFGVELAGGDTSEAPGEEILADVMVIGAVKQGKALMRSGARAGDGIYVTGALGGSAAELEEMRVGGLRRESGPQSFPEPRVAVGLELAKRGIAASCMDLSDGLSSDLRRICEASGVGAEIDAGAIPLGAGATLEQALHGGEDYELLFTARPVTRVPRRIAGIPITRIGAVVAAGGIQVDGRELLAGGWEHFAG
jgi:thiamine-monophosphate kinase